jgi:hypothetical protein
MLIELLLSPNIKGIGSSFFAIGEQEQESKQVLNAVIQSKDLLIEKLDEPNSQPKKPNYLMISMNRYIKSFLTSKSKPLFFFLGKRK